MPRWYIRRCCLQIIEYLQTEAVKALQKLKHGKGVKEKGNKRKGRGDSATSSEP